MRVAHVAGNIDFSTVTIFCRVYCTPPEKQGNPKRFVRKLDPASECLPSSEEAPMPSKRILLVLLLTLVYGFPSARVPVAFASSKANLQQGNRSGEAARTFKSLASFNGTNGDFPQYGSLLQGFDGNFYGTTYEGGVSSHCPYRQGCGTVFRITPAGKLSTVYNFCALLNCADGALPVEGLVQTTDGNFYGTAFGGGATGWGTVFKITAQGKLTTIYTFCAQGLPCPNGSGPLGGLMQATDGNFYGTTQSGGAYFGGTAFKITARGKLTTLHSFCARDCADGTEPMGVLVQATDGNFYGTTSNGGVNSSCSQITCGTVFKMTPSGKLTTLHTFCQQADCSDGASPWAGLVQTTDGNFYGTTSEGGTPNMGTVFRITPAGELTTLYTFCTQGNCTDGAGPIAALVQATDGGLYSTTSGGGSIGYGTVFKITPKGNVTTLFSFDSTNGCCLYTGLTQSTNGTFYSTTSGGGAANEGTVFSLAVGLRPFVEIEPASGKVGAAVVILGNDLASASKLSFNGTAATFTVISRTEIKATVPSGATTGFVTVTTPKKTLKSNVVFRVTK
jgi:uncharacterized repeat protein (TIGR03803 family)